MLCEGVQDHQHRSKHCISLQGKLLSRRGYSTSPPGCIHSFPSSTNHMGVMGRPLRQSTENKSVLPKLGSITFQVCSLEPELFNPNTGNFSWLHSPMNVPSYKLNHWFQRRGVEFWGTLQREHNASHWHSCKAGAWEKRDRGTSGEANDDSCDDFEYYQFIWAEDRWPPICVWEKSRRFNGVERPGLQPLVPAWSAGYMERAVVISFSILTPERCYKLVTKYLSPSFFLIGMGPYISACKCNFVVCPMVLPFAYIANWYVSSLVVWILLTLFFSSERNFIFGPYT